MMNWILNISFLVDMILTFFTALQPEKENDHYFITDKKIIAIAYMKVWFWLDLLSIIPFDTFFKDGEKTSSEVAARAAKLARLVRISKITRLARLFRMVRMIKLIRMIRSL